MHRYLSEFDKISRIIAGKDHFDFNLLKQHALWTRQELSRSERVRVIDLVKFDLDLLGNVKINEYIINPPSYHSANPIIEEKGLLRIRDGYLHNFNIVDGDFYEKETDYTVEVGGKKQSRFRINPKYDTTGPREDIKVCFALRQSEAQQNQQYRDFVSDLVILVRAWLHVDTEEDVYDQEWRKSDTFKHFRESNGLTGDEELPFIPITQSTALYRIFLILKHYNYDLPILQSGDKMVVTDNSKPISCYLNVYLCAMLEMAIMEFLGFYNTTTADIRARAYDKLFDGSFFANLLKFKKVMKEYVMPKRNEKVAGGLHLITLKSMNATRNYTISQYIQMALPEKYSYRRDVAPSILEFIEAMNLTGEVEELIALRNNWKHINSLTLLYQRMVLDAAMTIYIDTSIIEVMNEIRPIQDSQPRKLFNNSDESNYRYGVIPNMAESSFAGSYFHKYYIVMRELFSRALNKVDFFSLLAEMNVKLQALTLKGGSAGNIIRSMEAVDEKMVLANSGSIKSRKSSKLFSAARINPLIYDTALKRTWVETTKIGQRDQIERRSRGIHNNTYIQQHVAALPAMIYGAVSSMIPAITKSTEPSKKIVGDVSYSISGSISLPFDVDHCDASAGIQKVPVEMAAMLDAIEERFGKMENFAGIGPQTLNDANGKPVTMSGIEFIIYANTMLFTHGQNVLFDDTLLSGQRKQGKSMVFPSGILFTSDHHHVMVYAMFRVLKSMAHSLDVSDQAKHMLKSLDLENNIALQGDDGNVTFKFSPEYVSFDVMQEVVNAIKYHFGQYGLTLSFELSNTSSEYLKTDVEYGVKSSLKGRHPLTLREPVKRSDEEITSVFVRADLISSNIGQMVMDGAPPRQIIRWSWSLAMHDCLFRHKQDWYAIPLTYYFFLGIPIPNFYGLKFRQSIVSPQGCSNLLILRDIYLNYYNRIDFPNKKTEHDYLVDQEWYRGWNLYDNGIPKATPSKEEHGALDEHKRNITNWLVNKRLSGSVNKAVNEYEDKYGYPPHVTLHTVINEMFDENWAVGKITSEDWDRSAEDLLKLINKANTGWGMFGSKVLTVDYQIEYSTKKPLLPFYKNQMAPYLNYAPWCYDYYVALMCTNPAMSEALDAKEELHIRGLPKRVSTKLVFEVVMTMIKANEPVAKIGLQLTALGIEREKTIGIIEYLRSSRVASEEYVKGMYSISFDTRASYFDLTIGRARAVRLAGASTEYIIEPGLRYSRIATDMASQLVFYSYLAQKSIPVRLMLTHQTQFKKYVELRSKRYSAS